MKTDNLISALAADLPNRPMSPSRALATALMVSLPIASGLLLYVVQVRPDIWSALQTPGFDFKLAFLAILSLSSLWLVSRSSRPGTSPRPALIALAASFSLLLAALVLELLVVPSAFWMPRLIGNMSLQCTLLIPTMAIAPLAAILFAMRAGAPDNTTAAGAAAGLLAGAIGATFYAPHCPNDSPLYIAVWYLIGIAAVTVVGSLIGRFTLRW